MDTALIEHDFNGSSTNYSTSNISSEYYYDISDLAVGTYTWKMYANDSFGNNNITDQFTYVIEKATTSLTLMSSTSWNVVNTTETNVTCSADNDKVNITLYRNTTEIGSSIGGQISDIQTLAVNSYNYTCNTTGNQNYTADSETNLLTVHPKLVAICNLSFNPITDQQYPVDVNVSCACDNPETNAQLYRDGINVTSEIFTNVSLAAGSYNYICNVSETSNWDYAENTSTYVINQQASIVNLLLNNTDNNITVEYGINNTINITALMANPETGIVEIYQNNVLINSGQAPLENITTLTIGTYNITAVYPASQNYSSSYETHYIFVEDTTSPKWSNNISYPTSPVTYVAGAD